ncbi:MAG: T9SS type A sorting domain-containing protein [Bacteroidia bacterium]|nr:T9SS type A sorting domain-containing protein [Bacteroidia bacterium]
MMKKTLTLILFWSIAVLSSGFNAVAQNFIQNNSNRALSFKELQLQFHQYKTSNNLNTKKYWKQFKRYEADMQLHTNGHGEPDGFAVYVNEAVNAAQEKQANASASAPWYPVGPNAVPNNLTGYMENGIGRVNCVAFHPTNTSVFYVGVAQGGIWKTTNGGVSYTPLTDNLPITRISDICVDPNNPNTIYASVCDFEYIDKGLYLDGRKRHTHYGLGVYKTTDGGLTWNPTGLSFQLTNGDASLLRKIVINPTNSNELLACGVSGMYKTTNGGTTWVKQLDSLFWDMVQDPINPSVIYAATGWVKNANMGHAAIYKSTNFGGTWTMLNTGITMQGTVQRIKLAIAPSDQNYVYAMCCDNTDGFYGVYKSTNAGTSWTYNAPFDNILEWGQGGGSGGQGAYDMAFLVDATNKNTLYTGGINLWGSTDGGVSFNPISHWTFQNGTNTIHADVHFMDRQPGTGDVFVCCDGGIYKTAALQIGSWTSNWTTNWTNLSNGMQCTSFYRLSSSRNSKGRLIAGAQDNASFYYNGSSWSSIFGGDGMDNYLDPVNHQNIIGSSQFGNFFHSTDDGVTGNVVSTNPFNEAAEWTAPIVADYNHPGVLYVGNENIARSTNGGLTWSGIGGIYTNSTTLQNTEISALAVAATNSLVVYAARRVRYELGMKGFVFKTVNGGVSYSNITSNLPDSLYFTSMDVNPLNANEVVITMAGFSAGNKIFKSTNGGLNWTNISYNLPNVPVNCVKYLPGTSHLLLAADLGVYLLSQGATNWQSYSSGLPNVIVTDIEFNPILNKTYISTFGRGIWETSLSQIVTDIKNTGETNAVSFDVYPSVNAGNFSVKVSDGMQTYKLDIFDVNGRIVYSNELKDNSSAIKLNVAPGAYYLRLTNEERVGVKKIIVQ